MENIRKTLKNVLFLFVISLGYSASTFADDSSLQKVIIVEPFIEFHTGPGRGYPVFHIEEKGQQIELIKKKTQWFKIRAKRGQEGWVHEDMMSKTLSLDSEKFDAGNSEQSDFTKRTLEAGVMAGDFEGATSLTLYTGWNFTENLSAEIAVSQALGNVSDIRHGTISLLHQPFPDWRVTPFFKLGAGVIHTQPFTTLIQTEDRTDEIVLAGIGVKAYISREFFIRAEYSNYTILTSRNDNDEVEEWKLGFSVFF
ncbi:MAG: hypothetical protein KUG78_04995 [Kangiellaceae bacterium]|nr:hypothetical protein [Kangiellaceae bacterium]